MPAEQWQQVKEIFQSALERDPRERGAFLAEACAGHDALRKEVESLLRSHDEASSGFMESPAVEGMAETLLNGHTPASRIGQRLGHYQIISLIGEGGMGEVYLAQDEKLGRRVALKLLPADFTTDADRLRRFEQEAHAASALNHPGIITIHDIGQSNGQHFIATEYVDGETLRAHLAGKRLKLAEILDITTQVASALAAAHAADIIHRDIKPDNIMVRPDGYVKVLDFGLAKLMRRQATDPEATTKFRTNTGVVMGTAAYMSPEQARGLPVDARTDIFSLGSVLYEMTSGRAPFTGPTASDTIVNLLEREPPPLTEYMPDAPAELQRIIRKALRKDREERYQTSKDLLVDLRNLKHEVEAGARSPRVAHLLTNKLQGRRRAAYVALALLAVAALAFVIYKFASRRETVASQTATTDAAETVEIKKTTQITSSPGLDNFPSLSPDGNSIAYSSDQNGNFEIYIKPLTPGGREIQLTSDGQQNFHPAWSPDGQRIAYYSRKRGGIWLVPALGGAARQLTEFGAAPAWSRDGSVIAFQSSAPPDFGAHARNTLPPSTIWVVPSQGGTPRQVTQQGTPPGGHGAPAWSPDGKRIAFDADDFLTASLWSVSLDGGDLKQLAADGYDAAYAPDGKSLYYTYLGLRRIRVSPQTGEPVGEPVMVATGVPTAIRHATISADGKKIAYSVLGLSSNLWSIPLAAGSHEVAGAPVAFTRDTSSRNNLLSFSPDGRKVAFTRWRAGTSADIWIADADGKNPVQLTAELSTETMPAWFPDGKRIAFISDRDGNRDQLTLWSLTLETGKEEMLLDLGEGVEFARLSPDGERVAFNSKKSGTINVWMASLRGGEPQQLTFDAEMIGFPCWSPDGKFLALEIKRGDDTNVAIMPSDGGAVTQLTFEHGNSWPHSFSLDGERIAFAGQREGYWNIYWVSRDGKTQKQLTNYTKLNAYVRYPAWSPLDSQIIYEYAETTGNIWLMEIK